MILNNDISYEDRLLFEKAGKMYSEGNIQDALPILLGLANHNPSSAVLNATLANTYWDVGDVVKAEHFFVIAISINPKSEKISLGYFHLLWELGRKDDAIKEAYRFKNNSVMSCKYLDLIADLDLKIT